MAIFRLSIPSIVTGAALPSYSVGGAIRRVGVQPVAGVR